MEADIKKSCFDSCGCWAVAISMLLFLFFIIKIPSFLRANERSRLYACLEKAEKVKDEMVFYLEAGGNAFQADKKGAFLCKFIDKTNRENTICQNRVVMSEECPMESIELLGKSDFEIKYKFHAYRTECDICVTEQGLDVQEGSEYDECSNKQTIPCYHTSESTSINSETESK